MFDVLRWLIGNTVWFFIIGPALWRGGWPERTVAMINLAGMLLSPVFEYHLSARQLQFNLRVIDSCVTAGFLIVALTSGSPPEAGWASPGRVASGRRVRRLLFNSHRRGGC